MKHYRIDGPDVDTMIAKAVEERGEDWTWNDHYPNLDCIYYVTKSWAETVEEEYDIKLDVGPACLVGKIFHDLDPDLDALLIDRNPDPIDTVFGVYMEMDPWKADDWYKATFDDVTIEVSGLALEKLKVAQKAQDMSRTWGDAMREALEVGDV